MMGLPFTSLAVAVSQRTGHAAPSTDPEQSAFVAGWPVPVRWWALDVAWPILRRCVRTHTRDNPVMNGEREDELVDIVVAEWIDVMPPDVLDEILAMLDKRRGGRS